MPEAPEAEPPQRSAVTPTNKFPTLNRLWPTAPTRHPHRCRRPPYPGAPPARPSAAGAGSKTLAALGQLFGKEYSEPSKDFFPSFEEPRKFQ